MRTGVAIALYLAVTLMLAAFAGGCTLSSYGKLRRHSLARSRSLVFRLTAVARSQTRQSQNRDGSQQSGVR